MTFLVESFFPVSCFAAEGSLEVAQPVTVSKSMERANAVTIGWDPLDPECSCHIEIISSRNCRTLFVLCSQEEASAHQVTFSEASLPRSFAISRNCSSAASRSSTISDWEWFLTPLFLRIPPLSHGPKEVRAHGPSGRKDINRLGIFYNHPVLLCSGWNRATYSSQTSGAI